MTTGEQSHPSSVSISSPLPTKISHTTKRGASGRSRQSSGLSGPNGLVERHLTNLEISVKQHAATRSDQTSSAFKRLASIFKTACAETERATKELVARLTEDPTGEEGVGPKEGGGGGTGAGAGKEAGSTAGNLPSAESVIKAKKVERIKIMQVGCRDTWGVGAN